jgi:hypothetical protein
MKQHGLPPLRIESLSRQRLQETIECICAIWVEENTIARALGVARHDYLPVARSAATHALEDDLGLILVDPGTDEVVGFVLCIDFFDHRAQLEDERARRNPLMARWCNFLQLTIQPYLARFHGPEDAPLERGRVLYMNIGGVVPERRGHGWVIKSSLLAYERFGRARGFRHALAVATHHDSVPMLRRPPFIIIGEVEFARLADPDLCRITNPCSAVTAYSEFATDLVQ